MLNIYVLKNESKMIEMKKKIFHIIQYCHNFINILHIKDEINTF